MTDPADRVQTEQPRHPYDWRVQPSPETAAEGVQKRVHERWEQGLSIYGPRFQGDPLDNAEEEVLDEWHYIQAARRQRDALALALSDILAVVGDNKNGLTPLDTIGLVARSALELLEEKEEDR